MESSNLLSFKEQAALPPMDVMDKSYQHGVCGFNVDGRCISGGHNVAGSSGYRLASLGYPPKQAAAEGSNACAGCHAFPLWMKADTPYELEGMALKTSRLALIGKNVY